MCDRIPAELDWILILIRFVCLFVFAQWLTQKWHSDILTNQKKQEKKPLAPHKFVGLCVFIHKKFLIRNINNGRSLFVLFFSFHTFYLECLHFIHACLYSKDKNKVGIFVPKKVSTFDYGYDFWPYSKVRVSGRIQSRNKRHRRHWFHEYEWRCLLPIFFFSSYISDYVFICLLFAIAKSFHRLNRRRYNRCICIHSHMCNVCHFEFVNSEFQNNSEFVLK